MNPSVVQTVNLSHSLLMDVDREPPIFGTEKVQSTIRSNSDENFEPTNSLYSSWLPLTLPLESQECRLWDVVVPELKLTNFDWMQLQVEGNCKETRNLAVKSKVSSGRQKSHQNSGTGVMRNIKSRSKNTL